MHGCCVECICCWNVILLHTCFQGSSFYDSKLKQYGKIYKTHLFGNPTIRVVGEESVLYVLSGENDIVTSHWPKSTRLLLNGGLLLESSGPTHSLWKKAVLKAFSHKALDRLVEFILLELSLCLYNF